jgi:hypothetical protein
MSYASNVDLPKSMMAFELKDGTLLLIHKEDCEAIGNKIAMVSALNAHLVVEDYLKNKSQLSIGIKEVQQILEKYPDMDKDKKNEYFDVMIQLIKKATDLP